MKTKILLALLIALFWTVPAKSSNIKDTAADNTVILIHGLGRSASAMWLVDYRLKKQGYNTCSISYDSTKGDLNSIISQLHTGIEQCFSTADTSRAHFVTHSMGGPLLRAYRAQHPEARFGNIVMLSPPNKGSQLMNIAIQTPLGKSLFGAAAMGLAKKEASWISQLPETKERVGIIAGSWTFNPVVALLLQGEDDGAVSIEDMKIDSMADFIKISATHVTIRYSQEAVRQTVHFLENGSFSHSPKNTNPS